MPPAPLSKAELRFPEAVPVPRSSAVFAGFVSSVKRWGLLQSCLSVPCVAISEPISHSRVYKMVIWIKYFALYLRCQKGQINWSLRSGSFVLLAQDLILVTRLF